MTIYDYDNDFAHYECDEKERSKLGQVWTKFSTLSEYYHSTILVIKIQ